MLQNIKDLYGNKLAALDGDIGHIQDFYFDDLKTLDDFAYLVANTGSWLTGRHVLISPHAFSRLDQREKTLHIKLLKKQIEDSPSLQSHKQVSRPYEMEFYRYYGWPPYWGVRRGKVPGGARPKISAGAKPAKWRPARSARTGTTSTCRARKE